MLVGVPAAGYEFGSVAGTAVVWAVQLPSGPHCSEPGDVTLDTEVAQVTSAEAWVRSVTYGARQQRGVEAGERGDGDRAGAGGERRLDRAHEDGSRGRDHVPATWVEVGVCPPAGGLMCRSHLVSSLLR